MADRHLAPRPGSDVFILGWLARELLREGCNADELEIACEAVDVEHLRTAVEPFDLGLAVQRTGLEEGDLLDLLAAIKRHRQVSLLPGTGVSFSPMAVLTYWLIWVVGIITGSLDREGGMRFLPESRTMMDGPPRDDHAPAAGAFGPGPASRPELRAVFGERPAVALVDEIEAGNVRALMIMGANPVAAAPDPDRLLAALGELEVLAVFDIVEWDLTKIATHVVPCTWLAERNDMRFFPQYGAERTYVTPAIVSPVAERRHGWQVLSALGSRMGFDIFDGIPGIDAETVTDEQLMHAIGHLTCDHAEDVFAAGTDGLDVDFRYGWFHEKALPGGKWRLAPRVLTDRLPGALQRDDATGPRLVSGRTLGSVNSSHYAVPDEEGPPRIRISADLALRNTIETGDRVRVRTARGEVVAEAHVDASMALETVWIAHGFHGQNVNRLTDPTPDPLTGQPSVTGVPVEIERITV
jgi:anaerobic selenocysteine-containing dehydrogenase